jgi:secreted trypsin-like serine protease
VGGIEAIRHSWPSIAHLEFEYTGIVNIEGKLIEHSVAFMCAATLIDRQVVLTAGHCVDRTFSVYGENTNQLYTYTITGNSAYPSFESCFTIYLGMHDLNDKNNSTLVKKVSVRKAIQHENYDEDNFLNDIAILILNEEINLNDEIQIACLPASNIEYYPMKENIDSWITGWGALVEESGGSEFLQNVKITLYESEACENVYPNITKNWQSQLCGEDFFIISFLSCKELSFCFIFFKLANF